MRNDSLYKREMVKGHDWSIAQIVQALAGVFLTVLGGAVLLRTGFAFNPPAKADLLFTQTPWLASGEIFVGILLLVGSTSPRDRSLGTFLGLVLLSVGIILSVSPANNMVGGDSSGGVVLAIIGLIVAVTSFIAPTRRQDAAYRKEDIDSI